MIAPFWYGILPFFLYKTNWFLFGQVGARHQKAQLQKLENPRKNTVNHQSASGTNA
jgi:hypothetical protein